MSEGSQRKVGSRAGGPPPPTSRSAAGRASAPRGKGGGAARPFARTTGAPAKVTPTAVANARRLSQPELRDRLQLTEDEAKFLDACSSGRPPRNAQAGLAALKLRLDFAYEKPKQAVEHSGTVTLESALRAAVPELET